MKILALFFTIFFVQVTYAKFIPITLSDAWDDAEFIAKIEVLDTFPQYWESPRGKRPCGYTVTAKVNSVFKGKLSQKISFASEFHMLNGDIFLVFVNDYTGTFPSDEYWGEDFKAKKQACVNNLPTLKVNPLTSSKYTYDSDLVLPTYLLKFPKVIDVNEFKIDTVILNGKEVSIDNVPFVETFEASPHIRFIKAKQLEQWLLTK